MLNELSPGEIKEGQEIRGKHVNITHKSSDSLKTVKVITKLKCAQAPHC